MFNAIKMRVARFQIFLLGEFDKRKCITSFAKIIRTYQCFKLNMIKFEEDFKYYCR